MKKMLLGLCIVMLAVTSDAAKSTENTLANHTSNSYLKQQIQKKRLAAQNWTKQADGFIGLKRNAVQPDHAPGSKPPKAVLPGYMLTAQNLKASLENI